MNAADCFFRAAVVLGIATGLSMATSAFAIQRADDGKGQYLIVPVAIATDEYETLIEVSELERPGGGIRALKLRVLDRDGVPRQAANLYPERRGTWAAVLSRADGVARLKGDWSGCTLVEGPDGMEAVDEISLDFEFGSLEIVDMGRLGEPLLPPPHEAPDCDALIDLWDAPADDHDDSLRPPVGHLAARARIVNVSRGTLYEVPVTALKDFSDIPQHEPPGSALPDLASTHDAGTPDGQTRSVVCLADQCIEDFWADPIDAASAALMVHDVRDTYEIDPAMNARSEWVVTYPTMAYYPEDHQFAEMNTGLLVTDRTGRSFLSSVMPPPAFPTPYFSGSTAWLHHTRSVNLVDLSKTKDDVGELQSSSLFGIEHQVQVPGSLEYVQLDERLPDAGLVRLGFEWRHRPGGGLEYLEPLVANSGRAYLGRPAIVTTFMEYTNGTLPSDDGVLQRANYGTAGTPQVHRRVNEPGD